MTHHSGPVGTASEDQRPNTGPGAPCFHCDKLIQEFKPGAKRRTRKTAEFCDDACRMAYHRANPRRSPTARKPVFSYPGEHWSVPRPQRREAQSRRSLRELSGSFGPKANVVELPRFGQSPPAAITRPFARSDAA